MFKPLMVPHINDIPVPSYHLFIYFAMFIDHNETSNTTPTSINRLFSMLFVIHSHILKASDPEFI